MDEFFLRTLYDFSNTVWVDQLMFFFSTWAYKGIIFLILIFTLLKRTRQTGLIAVGAGVIGIAISRLIRWIHPRDRPFVTFDDIDKLLPKEATPSFPSEQGILAGLLIIMLWGIGGIWRWIGLAGGFLILISRVYVGHHYLSDVIVGSMLGIGPFLLICLLLKRLSS